jgi:hypothetical protein
MKEKNKDREDKTIENSSNIEKEKFPDESISKVESENLILNQETEIMEVHKHPHHLSDKKKWSEYLLEFLMIFLAVTMGFIAENTREKMVEKHREKQFMISLVRDLELDTLELSIGNKFRAQKIQAMDSALTILADQNTILVPMEVYKLFIRYNGCRSFYQNSGTLDQLKNSGGLRLISKRKIVDAIEEYDQQVKRMKVVNDVEIESFQYNDRLSQKLFDAKSVIKAYSISENPALISGSSELIKINVSYLSEYINNLINYNQGIRGNAFLSENCKQKAINLIQLIKKEYQLQNI